MSHDLQATIADPKERIFLIRKRILPDATDAEPPSTTPTTNSGRYPKRYSSQKS
jgi:hypothetical protein